VSSLAVIIGGGGDSHPFDERIDFDFAWWFSWIWVWSYGWRWE